MSYFYRGRHRAPTKTAKTAAAVAVAATGSVLGAPVALADTPPDAVAQCESGGDITAKNPSSSASGKWQIIASTWAAHGGLEFASEARYATEREQDIVAARIMDTQGLGAWAASDHCWGDESRASSGITPAEASEPEAPQPSQVTERATTQTIPKVQASGDYTVKSGDTLSEIAAEYGTSWQALYEKNDDTLSSPHRIFPGQQLDV